MSDELNIKINLTSNVAGANEAANAIEGVGKVAEHASEGSKGLSRDLHENAHVGAEAAEMFRHLDLASKGGIEGMVGAAKAVKNFAGILKASLAGAGPVGIAVAGIAVLGAAVLALREKFGQGGESAEKMGDKVQKAAETVTKFDQLNIKFEKQKTELDKLREKYTLLKAAEDAAYAAAQRVSDAQTGKKLADINLTEQKGLAGATTEDQKKEIQARAEAQRTLATSAAEQAKKEAEVEKAKKDQASLIDEYNATQKGLNALLQTHLKSELEAAQTRLKAATGGVKSDQESALIELNRLRAKQEKEDAQVEPFKKAGFENVVRTVEDTPEAVARRARIAELSKQEPDLKASVDAGKETFTGTAEKLKADLETASKAFKSDATEANANILGLVKAKLAIAEQLSKTPSADKLKEEREKLERDAASTLGGIRNRIVDTTGILEAGGIDKQTLAEKGAAELLKQKTSVEEDNRKRQAAAEASQLSQRERELQAKGIEDQLSKVFSTSAEGQALTDQLNKLRGGGQVAPLPRPINVPELDKPIPGITGNLGQILPDKRGAVDLKPVTEGAKEIGKSLDDAGKAKPDLKPAVEAAQKFASGQVQWNGAQVAVVTKQAETMAAFSSEVQAQKEKLDSVLAQLEALNRAVQNSRSNK